MKTKIILNLAIISIVGILFSSCKKDASLTEQEPITNENQILTNSEISKIKFTHGMLVFESIEEYISVINNKELSFDKIIAWESELNFISQANILKQALQEEEKYFEQFNPQKMTKEEIAKVISDKKEKGFTDFTKKYITLGLLKPYSYENISSLELTVVSKIDPIFLNLEGMVKIGNIIYQYTPTQCKQITDGDFNKMQLLKESTKNSENIKIGNLANEKSDFHDYLTYPELVLATEGHYQIQAGILLRIWDYDTYKDYYYYLQYKNYKERWFFGWDWKEDTNADTDVYGSVKVTVQGEAAQYFNINFSKDNFWSYHIPLIEALPLIPAGKTVTFSNAGFTFKRNNVSSSVYRTHAIITI